jgi:site-specific recombinase XerC
MLEIEKMARKPTKRRWTASDNRTVKALARQKKRAGQIARILERTEGAVRQHAFEMGLSLDSRA